MDRKPLIEEDSPMLAVVSEGAHEMAGPKIELQQKKSSIFKSRFTASQAGNSSSTLTKEVPVTSKGRKGLALYRHKWHEDERKPMPGSSDAANNVTNATSTANSSDMQQHTQSFSWNELDDQSEGVVSKSTRSGSSTASSAPSKTVEEEEAEDALSEGHSGGLRCARKVKDYYTVVRNVKKAHQIQESGEFQEFNDDVDYILDALQDRNPTATRLVLSISSVINNIYNYLFIFQVFICNELGL